MVILLENDYLFYGGYSALQNFYLIISPIIIMEQKRKWYLGIRAIKAFEYENTSDVKMMQLLRKKKIQTTAKCTRNPRDNFRNGHP